MLTTNKFIAIITFLSAILLSTSYQASSNEPDKAGLSPTDYFKFTFVKDPQVSPNGENILFVKSQALLHGRPTNAFPRWVFAQKV